MLYNKKINKKLMVKYEVKIIMSKIFDPLMIEAVICLYQNKFSYEKIVDLFCNKCTTISKPTVQRIVHTYTNHNPQPKINKQIKSAPPVLKEESSIELEEDQELIVNSCNDDSLSDHKDTNELEKNYLSDVDSSSKMTNTVDNIHYYNDWTTARFNNFLNENESIIKKYNESQIWDIATSMTIVAENRKITEEQMKTVIKELYKHTDKLSLENISKAVDICKNQKLI